MTCKINTVVSVGKISYVIPFVNCFRAIFIITIIEAITYVTLLFQPCVT